MYSRAVWISMAPPPAEVRRAAARGTYERKMPTQVSTSAAVALAPAAVGFLRRATAALQESSADNPLGPPRAAEYSKFPAKKKPSIRALALAPASRIAASPPRERRTQVQARTRSYFSTPLGRGVSPRQESVRQESKVLCERPPSVSLNTSGRPVSSDSIGAGGVVPTRRARSAELISEWQPTALWQPKPVTPGATGASPFAAFSPPRSATLESRSKAKLGGSFDRHAPASAARALSPDSRRNTRRSMEKRQFHRQLDSLSAEIIATLSHTPVRTLHRRWHGSATVEQPTSRELDAAVLAEVDAAGGSMEGDYSLRALLHEVGMVQHLPRLLKMQINHETLLRTHSWNELERLGFTRVEAQRLHGALEKARKRSVTQLLGSLTRQRVREGTAVRDAKIGLHPWRSPFQKKLSVMHRRAPKLGPPDARPHSRSGLEGASSNLEAGGEALGMAGQILSLRSRLAAARDEQLQAELLEEGELLGWAPLSEMQSFGGAFTETNESLGRLEGRVTYSLGQSYVQAPLGEAPRFEA